MIIAYYEMYSNTSLPTVKNAVFIVTEKILM